MTNRRLLILGLLLAVVAIGLFSRAIVAKDARKDRSEVRKPVQMSPIRKVVHQPYVRYAKIGGYVTARHRIDLVAEVSGTLKEGDRAFEPGMRFSSGERVYELNEPSFRYALLSQKSQYLNTLTQFLADYQLEYPGRVGIWRRYVSAYDIHSPIPPLPQVQSTKEKLFLNARQIISQYYEIKRQEALLDKYRFVAPFDGVLTQRHVKVGNRVAPGQAMATFTKLSDMELLTYVPVAEAAYISTGSVLTLDLQSARPAIRASVVQVGSVVQPDRQMVGVLISIQDGRVLPGTYVTGKIRLRQSSKASLLPKGYIGDDQRVVLLKDGEETTVVVSLLETDVDGTWVLGLPDNASVLPVP